MSVGQGLVDPELDIAMLSKVMSPKIDFGFCFVTTLGADKRSRSWQSFGQPLFEVLQGVVIGPVKLGLLTTKQALLSKTTSVIRVELW